MKLTANFSLAPIDIYNITETQMRPAAAMEMDKDLDDLIAGKEFTDDQWRHLHVTRYQGDPVIIDYTGEEKEFGGIPVIDWDNRVYKDFSRKRGYQNMVVLTPGTLLIKHHWCMEDPDCKNVTTSLLEEMNIPGLEYSREIEINNMKIGGFVNRIVHENKMATEGSLIFDYSDRIFSKIPDLHYSRSYLPGKKSGKRGITGLLQEIPGFNTNGFIQKLIINLGYGNIYNVKEGEPA